MPSAACLLDLDFGDGSAFLASWRSWQAESGPTPSRTHPRTHRPEAAGAPGVPGVPGVRHYVALLPALPTHPWPDALRPLAFGLGPGMHRLLLDGGRVQLSLCIGDSQTLLGQLSLQADAIRAPQVGAWDSWRLKALARLCRPGTRLLFGSAGGPGPALLRETGFVPVDAKEAIYQPAWQTRKQRAPQRLAATAPGRCAVIGAGLAGASVAHALALRGWQVTVLDAAAHAAAGASGLPVGLVVPHHSADDSPRSQLSRCGVRLTLQAAQQLLEAGQDWGTGGVMERQIDAHTLPGTEAEVLSRPITHRALPPAAAAWAEPCTYAGGPALWHRYGAWIRPARLVAAWLHTPGIRFVGQARVAGLERLESGWRLHNDRGDTLAEADQVVIANAHGAQALLQPLLHPLLQPPEGLAPSDGPWVAGLADRLAGMQVLHGTLSHGAMPEDPGAGADPDSGPPVAAAFPPFPVNGHGSLVAGVPDPAGPRWYAGSTFQADPLRHAALAGEHAANAAKLQTLLPGVAEALAPQFVAGSVGAWQGSRCVTHDRLPLVGPLLEGPRPTLWLSAGMGARGLGFAALCAEVLVAELCGEPLPIEKRLWRHLQVGRGARRSP